MRNPRRIGLLTMTLVVSACGKEPAECDSVIRVDIDDKSVYVSKNLCHDTITNYTITTPQEKNSTIHIEYVNDSFVFTPQHLVVFEHTFADDSAAYSTDSVGYPIAATYNKYGGYYTVQQPLALHQQMVDAYESVGLATLVPRFAKRVNLVVELEDSAYNTFTVKSSEGVKSYEVKAGARTSYFLDLPVGLDMAFEYKWATRPSYGADAYVLLWER